MVSALVLFGLGALAGVRAQSATSASIFFPLPQPSDEALSGEIVGTGADGTTFVISASGTEAGDIPFTMTVVQDATHVSAALSLATGLGANAQCAYNTQGVGACTIVFEGGGSDTATDAAPQTTVVSGTIPLIAVPVTTAAPSATSPSGSGGGSATDTASAEATSTSSGAERSVVTTGLAAVLSMFITAFISA